MRSLPSWNCYFVAWSVKGISVARTRFLKILPLGETVRGMQACSKSHGA